MPPAPATRADAPPSGGGKKIMGLPRNQFLIIAGIGAALIIGLVIYRLKKNQSAASTSTTAASGTGGCPDGSAPDANGNCPDSTDLAGQLATLQTEIGDLEANQGAGASGGTSGTTGTSGTVAASTGTPATPATTGTSGGTSTAAPSTPGTQAAYKFPAPTGFKATRVSSHGCTLSWNPVTGPGGQKPVSYTVKTTGGGLPASYTHIAAGTSTGEYGPGGTGLKPSTTYTSEVWANGAPVAPPHATTTFTTLKAGG